MNSFLEWASRWNGHQGGTGIKVEWASWWNGHLARYNSQAVRMPTPPSAIDLGQKATLRKWSR
ncbi:MAG: hypothetical protein F6K65_36750 [Moorea sp. SIO3C2]|nr:hypothetical protein [Moorena sp. SIO3C2]